MAKNPSSNGQILKLISRPRKIMIWTIIFCLVFSLTKLWAVVVTGFLIGGGLWFYAQSKANDWRKNPNSSEILLSAREEAKEKLNQATQTKSLMAKYQVGLEQFSLNGHYTISSAQDGLSLTKSLKKGELTIIPWKDLIEVEAGSESDLRSRVTASRLLLTGVFAFGLKKERKKDFYISIATPSSVGLFALNTSGKDNRANEKTATIFAAACNARIRSANPVGVAKAESAFNSSYSEIEKLGELLEKSLLTQDEFNSKKKQILGL